MLLRLSAGQRSLLGCPYIPSKTAPGYQSELPRQDALSRDKLRKAD